MKILLHDIFAGTGGFSTRSAAPPAEGTLLFSGKNHRPFFNSFQGEMLRRTDSRGHLGQSFDPLVPRPQHQGWRQGKPAHRGFDAVNVLSPLCAVEGHFMPKQKIPPQESPGSIQPKHAVLGFHDPAFRGKHRDFRDFQGGQT